MMPVETVPGIWGGEMKDMMEVVNASIIYLIHCKTIVNATMYPHTSQQKEKYNKMCIFI
jgi:hypothetical protein